LLHIQVSLVLEERIELSSLQFTNSIITIKIRLIIANAVTDVVTKVERLPLLFLSFYDIIMHISEQNRKYGMNLLFGLFRD